MHIVLQHYVSRERLRNAVRVTDPINRALRWRGVLTARRPYSVPGPNALWHIGRYVQCVQCMQYFISYFLIHSGPLLHDYVVYYCH